MVKSERVDRRQQKYPSSSLPGRRLYRQTWRQLHNARVVNKLQPLPLLPNSRTSPHKRHTNRFSILARDTNGDSILGFLNDRIRNHHELQDNWLPGSGIPGLLRPRIGSTHWPTIISVCMMLLGLMVLAIILIRSRLLGRLWTCCPGPYHSRDESISSKDTSTTSLA